MSYTEAREAMLTAQKAFDEARVIAEVAIARFDELSQVYSAAVIKWNKAFFDNED